MRKKSLNRLEFHCQATHLPFSISCVSLTTKDFDYHLPEELIASRPLDDRAASRMMVIHRATGLIEHKMFRDFPSYVQDGDQLVLNDTKVIPARLFSIYGKSEILCLDPLAHPLALSGQTWEKNARRCHRSSGRCHRLSHRGL
jgi:S-adenosylmethionine:tRNA ribosyltransferase-isomerase